MWIRDSASGLCLAQEHTRGKGNEIPAIKALLDTLTLKAVSYTHLDVYKRQEIPCGA